MSQWIAIGLTILGSILTGAILFGRMSQRQDAIEMRVKELEDNSQTPAEREAIAKAIDIRFAAHDELDDTRFANLHAAINLKLDLILDAIRKNGNNNGR